MHRARAGTLLASPATALALLAALAVPGIAGCGGGSEPSAHVTRSVVREYIRERGDHMAFQDPSSGEVVEMTFVSIHDPVRDTAGGREEVCVDFKGKHGTVYDMDYYLGGAPHLEVQDVVMHRAGDETVISDAERARLEDESGAG